MIPTAFKKISTLNGSIKELLILFVSFLMITGCSSLFAFIQRYFLGKVSAEYAEAGMNVLYSCKIFQNPCILMGLMAQVSVGRLYGANQLEKIGCSIWQFIWFSILSMFITLPASFIYGKLYFKHTILSPIAHPYYYILNSINFLYPLGACLSCFFLGRSYTRLVVCLRLSSELLTLGLTYFFLFGKAGFPKLGLLGVGISDLIGQGIFCFILLSIFLSPQNAKMYGSWNWKFYPHLFWESIKPGFWRGISSILNTSSWASVAHLVVSKSPEHAVILANGGSLFLFFGCFGESLGQAMTVIISQMLGAKSYSLLTKAFRSGVVLAVGISLISSTILYGINQYFFHDLFPETRLADVSINRFLTGVAICIIFYTLIYIPISYILAFKDTFFSFLMGAFAWVNTFVWMYMAIHKIEIPAYHFWTFLSLSHISGILLYALRAKKLVSRVIADPLLPIQ
jgi:MATE family multidrug resistance protein